MTYDTDAQNIAQYLIEHPEFFSAYGEVLINIRLPSPQTGTAVSLYSRQLEVLNQKIRTQNNQLSSLIHAVQTNREIVQKMNCWTNYLLSTENKHAIVDVLTTHLSKIFNISQVCLKLWSVKSAYADESYVCEKPSDYLKTLPQNGIYCGPFDKESMIATWLNNETEIGSIVTIALRESPERDVFGLLILAESDPKRYTPDMATDFLQDIGSTASAATIHIIDK